MINFVKKLLGYKIYNFSIRYKDHKNNDAYLEFSTNRKDFCKIFTCKLQEIYAIHNSEIDLLVVCGRSLFSVIENKNIRKLLSVTMSSTDIFDKATRISDSYKNFEFELSKVYA